MLKIRRNLLILFDAVVTRDKRWFKQAEKIGKIIQLRTYFFLNIEDAYSERQNKIKSSMRKAASA